MAYPTPEEIVGSDDPKLCYRLVTDLSHSLSGIPGDREREERLESSAEAVKALAPGNVLEAHLITQMICAHNLLSECMALANQPRQSVQERGMALKYAAKFMALFQDQARTLTKQRGPMQRKVPKLEVSVTYVNPPPRPDETPLLDDLYEDEDEDEVDDEDDGVDRDGPHEPSPNPYAEYRSHSPAAGSREGDYA